MQKHSIESALPGTEPESVQSDRTNDTERSDTLCAALDRTTLISELFRSAA